MKKARQWLDEHSVAYVFHDYRKAGISPELIQLWIEKVGWEALLNKRGTTWRNLSEEEKTDIFCRFRKTEEKNGRLLALL